jgi:hypothetical protein
MEDRSVDAKDAHGIVRQTCRRKDDRGLREQMRLAVNRELDFAAEILGVGRIGAEEADELVAIVRVLHEYRVSLGHSRIPCRVHLERPGHHFAIDPDDASLSIQFSSDKESLDDMVYDRISGIFDLDTERAKCANNEYLWLYVTKDYQVYSCVTSTPSITKSEKLLLDLSSYPDQ